MDAQTYARFLQPARSHRDEVDRTLRRLRVQREFVGAMFGERHPEAIAEADARVKEAGSAEKALEAFEDTLAFLSEESKLYTLHCVGHGHLDMNWMWSWQETVSAGHDTFRSVLALMDEFPEVTYSQSQAALYALIGRYHPSLLDRLMWRIQEGRWEVTALQWVEGDKNYVLGDSLFRHFLYSREYCRETLGLKDEDLRVQWEPDTFGHAGTIPMIGAQGGVEYYYACRTGGGFEHVRVGEERPPLFWWESESGDRILVNRETSWYNSYVNIGDNIAGPAVAFYQKTGSKHWLNVYGIGNHGGGPTRREIRYYQEIQKWPLYPTLQFSTSQRYFDAVKAEDLSLPSVSHELNFEFTGCYSSQSLIKQADALGQSYCLEAEALAVMAGTDQPAFRREAWQRILFNQFHDILTGSGVRETREHAMANFQEAAALTSSLKREAMLKLEESISTRDLLPAGFDPGPGDPFVAGSGLGARLSGVSRQAGAGTLARAYVLYNPLAWDRTDVMTLSVYDYEGSLESLIAIDSQGRAQRPLLVDKGWDWDHDRAALLILAEVPASGYATYLLMPDDGRPVEQPLVQFQSGTHVGGVQFDRHRGSLTIERDLGRLYAGIENPYMMTSWVSGQDRELEWSETTRVRSFNMYAERRNQGTLEASGASPFALGTYEYELFQSSKATVRALVSPHSPRVDLQIDLNWREIGDANRGIPFLAIESGLTHPTRREAPFGASSASGRELPFVRWLGDERGTWLCEGKHAFRDGRIVLIRSSYDPDPLPEVNQQVIRLAYYPHTGTVSDAQRTRWAMEWAHPFLVSSATFHGGTLPLKRTGLSIDGVDAVVTAVKPAESGEGVVVTVVNYGDSQGFRFRGHDGYTNCEPVDASERPNGTSQSIQSEVRIPAKSARQYRLQ